MEILQIPTHNRRKGSDDCPFHRPQSHMTVLRKQRWVMYIDRNKNEYNFDKIPWAIQPGLSYNFPWKLELELYLNFLFLLPCVLVMIMKHDHEGTVTDHDICPHTLNCHNWNVIWVLIKEQVFHIDTLSCFVTLIAHFDTARSIFIFDINSGIVYM